MHLKWTSFLLALASTGLALKANQPCGDNVDCASTCEKGRFHNVESNGTFYFGCKFDTPQRDYTVIHCKMGGTNSLSGEAFPVDKDEGKKICQAAAGTACSYKCIVLNSQVEQYKQSCKEAGDKYYPSKTSSLKTYDEARQSSC